MKAQNDMIYGVSAPAPRLTPWGAALIAAAIAVPAGLLLSLADWVLF